MVLFVNNYQSLSLKTLLILFKYIIQYTKENRDKLTGEVRFIVEPYTSTSPYYTTGTVQFILKE